VLAFAEVSSFDDDYNWVGSESEIRSLRLVV
jgi:hypothetical protein